MKKKLLKFWRLISSLYVKEQQVIVVEAASQLNEYIEEGWTIKSISAVSYEIGDKLIGYKVNFRIYAVIERRVRK